MRFGSALAGFAASVVIAAPATAQRGVEDPRGFVENVYATALDGQGDPAANVYSDRLRALFADESSDAGGEIGRLDFDYWTSAQDYQVSNVRVTEEEVYGRSDRRIVIASFLNYDVPVTNRFYFERVGGRWFLDDVRNVAAQAEGGWTLSLLLKYGS